MSDAEAVIPEITEDDIEWVRLLMGLDDFDKHRRHFLKQCSTVDLSACPGSGKTTLIVAKLAILAKRWPHLTRGICVLSHTNVAREQIEQQLGRTVVGQRLLSYPHFVDTIHGFVNRFLALPWLYSNGYPSPTIDDDLTTAYRRDVLASDYWIVQNFLEKKRSDFNKLRICGRDLSFDLCGKPFPSSPSSSSYQHAKRAVETAAKAGYFCYDEMFVLARALLEDQENIPKWLTHRFPLVILDEMQDTSKRQVSFLNDVFPRGYGYPIVQRVGDPNQEIFDLPDTEFSTSDLFPDPVCSLEIPNSYRFGVEIASIASPFAVHSVGTHGLSGVGPKGSTATYQKGKHAIFVFPDESTEGVLDAFGKHALNVLGSELITKGAVTAVGHIHQDYPDVSTGHSHYPKSVGHYWSGYAVEISRKDPNPKTLAQYVRAAQGLANSGRTLSPGVEKIAASTLQLARRIGDIGDLKRKASLHRTVLEALENDADLQTTYLDFLKYFLVEKKDFSGDNWSTYSNMLMEVATTLCSGETDTSKAEQFLVWPENNSVLSVSAFSGRDAGPNIFRVSDNSGTVNIRLGSIHSVKGQTHLATLVLNTYWYDHSAKRMITWLLGEKSNGMRVGMRDKQRLLHTYVAMTRPSHLLCLAMPCSALGCEPAANQKIATLKRRGWHVANVVNGVAHWRE